MYQDDTPATANLLPQQAAAPPTVVPESGEEQAEKEQEQQRQAEKEQEQQQQQQEAKEEAAEVGDPSAGSTASEAHSQGRAKEVEPDPGNVAAAEAAAKAKANGPAQALSDSDNGERKSARWKRRTRAPRATHGERDEDDEEEESVRPRLSEDNVRRELPTEVELNVVSRRLSDGRPSYFELSLSSESDEADAKSKRDNKRRTSPGARVRGGGSDLAGGKKSARGNGGEVDQIYDISIIGSRTASSQEEEAHTVYVIEMFSLGQDEPIRCSKRFSQFCALHSALRESFPGQELPSLPSRVVLGNALDPKLIETRRRSLDKYLKELLNNKRVWNSFHIKLFFNLYDLSGKVAIITGASSGVGFYTASTLAHMNAHVVFACRARSKTELILTKLKEETGNENLEYMELNLASLDSVRHFADAFAKRKLPLHLLINNAGVAGALGQLTQEGFEIHMGVNYIGHFLLTNLLLEDLIATAESSGNPTRIVNVASRAHTEMRDLMLSDSYIFTPCTKMGVYSAFLYSKLALVTFTNELARRLEGTDVVVNAVHPGPVATESYFRQAWNPIPISVNWLSKKFLISQEEGARCSLFAALAEETASVRGRYFENCQERPPNPVSRNPALMTRLWEHSESWTGLAE